MRGAYLLDWLNDIGYTNHTKPHSIMNIVAWADHVGIKMTTWEISLMVSLSSTYLSSFKAYSDPKDFSSQPYMSDEERQEARENIANARRATLMRLKERNKGK